MARPQPRTVALRDQALAALRTNGPLTTNAVAHGLPHEPCTCRLDRRSECPSCRGTGWRRQTGREAYKLLAGLEKLGFAAAERDLDHGQNLWFYVPQPDDGAEFTALIETIRLPPDRLP